MNQAGRAFRLLALAMPAIAFLAPCQCFPQSPLPEGDNPNIALDRLGTKVEKIKAWHVNPDHPLFNINDGDTGNNSIISRLGDGVELLLKLPEVKTVSRIEIWQDAWKGKGRSLARAKDISLRFDDGTELKWTLEDKPGEMQSLGFDRRETKAVRIAISSVYDRKEDGAPAPDYGGFAEIKVFQRDVPETAPPRRVAGAGGDMSASPRPVAKDGIFYLSGKPKFIVGVHHHAIYEDFPRSRPGCGPNWIYRRPMDGDVAREFGFDAVETTISSAPLYRKYAPGKLGSWSSGVGEEKFIEGLGGLPLLVDNSWGLCWFKSVEKGCAQKCPWPFHFTPFCFEDPKGMEIYDTMWEEMAKLPLASGGNPWVYEIWNEPAYDCGCQENQRLFRVWLAERYAGIGGVNGIWGSSYSSFDEIEMKVGEPDAVRPRNMWIDWVKFLGDRFVELYKHGVSKVRSIDKRDNVYFTVQPLNSSFVAHWGSNEGYDPYKFSKVVDIGSTEGGFSFGGVKPKRPLSREEQALIVAPGNVGMMFHLDMARALHRGKPLMNNELYTHRFDSQGGRAPVERCDFTTNYWSQLVHGCDGAFHFLWTKAAWTWKTPEEAKKTKEPWALLNPALYPPDTLYGIKDFQDEVGLLGDLVLPKPRIKGEIAFLYSLPSQRQAYMDGDEGFWERVQNNYAAMLFTHHPSDVILEEQLGEGAGGDYKAIVCLGAKYVYASTPQMLRDYVERGGVLICGPEDLAYDEYGRRLGNAGLLGTPSEGSEGGEAAGHDGFALPGGSAPAPCPTADPGVKPEGSGKILATKVVLGKGKVYFIGTRAGKDSLSELILSALEDANIRRKFDICTENGRSAKDVEVQLIGRKDAQLYYLVNWDSRNDDQVFILKVFPGKNSGRLYVADPLLKKVYETAAGGQEWDAHALNDGIPVTLSPQRRKFLILSESKEIIDRYAPASVKKGAPPAP